MCPSPRPATRPGPPTGRATAPPDDLLLRQAGRVRFTTTVELARTTATGMDLAEALVGQPGARTAWAALSYSEQRRHVLAVEGAKAPETRLRRTTAVVAALTPPTAPAG